MATAATRTQFSAMHVGGSMAVQASVPDVLHRRRKVALLARHARVRAAQLELGGIVIEQNIASPAPFVMTRFAVRPLPAAVHVVVAMTGIATRRQTFGVQIAAMTIRATNLGVLAAERIACIAIVLERRAPPVGYRVAGFTSMTKLALMRILGAVAADARRRCLPLGNAVLVTTLARHLDMRAEEREVRVAGMVEFRLRPSPRGVARSALLADVAVMLVVAFVTSNACCRGWLVALGHVTTLALHRAMPPLERKGGGMIETHALPFALVVTVVARRPERGLMRIVVTVAIVAKR